MKKQYEHTTVSYSDKLKKSYKSPKVSFIPQKVDEKTTSMASKKYTFAVPIGCCR